MVLWTFKRKLRDLWLCKYRDKSNETGIMYNDIDLNIKWPVKKPIISDKDKET